MTESVNNESVCDAVVIGAGLNGLTAATVLARGGRGVIVVEAREVVGGLAAAEEFHPGYRSAGLLHDTTGLLPQVVDQLGLARHGLRRAPHPPSVYCASVSDGSGLLVYHDPERTAAELDGAAAHDAQSYHRYRAFLGRLRPFARTLLTDVPPDWLAEGLTDLSTLITRGLALRRLGRVDLMELMRLGPMSLNDWLGELFENPRLRAAPAVPALHGVFGGPLSPGTVGPLLRYEALAGGNVIGGPAAVAAALGAAAREAGVDLRTAQPVSRIIIERGRATGVTCADGHIIRAKMILSSCDPKRTFLTLVGANELTPSFVQHIRAYRTRSLTAKVHLALSRPIRFTGRPDVQPEFAQTAQAPLDLERAFDAAKYRRFSETPVLDIHVPSVSDPSLAPPGHAVVSVLVIGVPYDLDGGWTDAKRDQLGNAVVRQLARFTDGLEDSVVAKEVLTPVDIESRYGTTGGHICHGEHALDQLLVRPARECARYATPIEGLYLCGSGAHPGGGITCAPGLIAAKRTLRASG